MLRIKKHIILVGNSSRRLITLQQRIREIAPETSCYMTDISSIPEVLCSLPADMILVYTDNTVWFSFVQQIRREPLADSVPVFVCRDPLEEEVLRKLLNGGNRYEHEMG